MNEESIFAAAMLKPAGERVAFFDQACQGNADLRAQLEELLAAHAAAGSFFEHPPAGLDPTMVNANSSKETYRSANWDGSLAFLAPCDKADRIGKLGQYEVIEVVGHGGMGVVLRAFDSKLSRIVAVKVLAPELAASPTAVKRFLREAKTAAAVVHSHVVTIHSVENDARPPYLVMEFIEGQTLLQKIEAEGALKLKHILRIGSQMAEGLAAAHKHGLIHRDVKPGNILLENGVERVKITDFGLARAADDLEMTQSGLIAGTPQYMSPEQAKGDVIDTRSDLFALGSVLYAMCTGRSAFCAETTMGVLHRVCNDTPRPIHEVNPEIPAWLEAIVDTLLAKDPGQRFQTAAELADLLGQYLAHVQNPSQVPQPVGWDQLAQRVPSHQVRPAQLPPEKNGGPSAAGAALSHPTQARHRRSMAVAAGIWLLLAGLGLSEATGVTNLAATVIRITRGEGTIVVEIDDPTISLTIDGEDIVITEAGAKEIRVRPGQHKVSARKDGQAVLIDQPLVTIHRGGKQVVRVVVEPLEPAPTVENWPALHLIGDWVDNDGEWGDVRILGTREGYRGTYTATFNGEPGSFSFERIGERTYRGQWWESDRKFHGRLDLEVQPDGQTISVPWVAEDGRNRTLRSTWTRKTTPDPWVPLFNGKDLAGWRVVGGTPATWSVENGILRGAGSAGFLVSERKQTHFHLRAEMRISPGGEWGMHFRSNPDGLRQSELSSRGVGAKFTYRGSTNDVDGHMRMEVRLMNNGTTLATTTVNLKPNHWFPIELIAQGDSVDLKLSGGGLGASKLGTPPTAGPIILELPNANSALEFRTIEIMEL